MQRLLFFISIFLVFYLIVYLFVFSGEKNITHKETQNNNFLHIDTPFFENIACKNIEHYINKNTKNIFLEAKKNKNIPLKIVCFGNSITSGFKVGTGKSVENPYPKIFENLLKKDVPQIQVINEGHNGWRTDHAINNIQAKVLDKNPQIVFLEFGINDAYSNFSLELFEKNISNLIKILQQKNIIPVLLTPTPITSQFREKVEKYCGVLQKISKQQDISLINLQKEITQKAITEKISQKKLLPDNIHFGDEFYAWIAEIINGELRIRN